jgi:hypothetical protein
MLHKQRITVNWKRHSILQQYTNKHSVGKIHSSVTLNLQVHVILTTYI